MSSTLIGPFWMNQLVGEAPDFTKDGASGFVYGHSSSILTLAACKENFRDISNGDCTIMACLITIGKVVAALWSHADTWRHEY